MYFQNSSCRVAAKSSSELTSRADATLRAVNAQVTGSPGPLSLFADREIRQVRRQLRAVKLEQAAELAAHQIQKAADKKLLDAALEGQQRRTAIRKDHNERLGNLTSHSTRLAVEAIHRQLSAEESSQQRLLASECDAADKQMLSNFFRDMAANQINRIKAEHRVVTEQTSPVSPRPDVVNGTSLLSELE